jgi:hypothetical protein
MSTDGSRATGSTGRSEAIDPPRDGGGAFDDARDRHHGSNGIPGMVTDMRISRLGLLCVLVSAWIAACVADDADDGTDDANDDGASDDIASSGDSGEAACDTAQDCEACLAIAGCNWTGDTCLDTCLQDTSCYGPGNPSAPACPDTETTGGECGELGSDCFEGTQCCEGLVCQGDLVPTCVDPEQCLPDGAQCGEASECCEGRECTGEEVLVCTAACAGEGASCADVACCEGGLLYCEPELQICVLPPD